MSEYLNTSLLCSIVRQINYRGVPTPDIVCEMLDIRDKLDILGIDPVEATGSAPPPGCTEEEWAEGHRKFWTYLNTRLLEEIERRRNIADKFPSYNADREIIQTIKERIPVEDVLSWYTEVFYHGRGSRKEQLQFRCPLHKDEHPSGIAYLKESRWHCYQCQAHGDIFDAVCLCERVDMHTAIKKLGAYLGIEIRPLREKPPPAKLPVRGMKGLEL